MYAPVIVLKYILHQIISMTGVNNDFIQSFKKHVLHDRIVYPEFNIIEEYRTRLGKNHELLELSDMGAGTRFSNQKRTIAGIAKVASVRTKYGELLFRLVKSYASNQIVELGTACGISTMYLAMGNPGATVISVEGNPQLAELAGRNFITYGINNIRLINKSFDKAIQDIAAILQKKPIIFIDGNHTQEATLRYYDILGSACCNNGIFIIDDINWSFPMARAWKTITTRGGRNLIIDLFQLGIIFQGQGHYTEKFHLRY